MSLKLLFSLLILQLTSTINIKATELYGISKEVNGNNIDNGNISQEDSNGDISDKNDKKVTHREWNVIVKDLKMVDEEHDKETIEALEEGEIAGVRWDPLAKDIAYKILVKQGNHINNENVSVTPLFENEDPTTWSPVKKHKFKSEEINTLLRKKTHTKTFVPDPLPYLKQIKMTTMRNIVRSKNKNHQLKNESNRKRRQEGTKPRISSEIKNVLEAYLEDRKDYNTKYDSSLKSGETKILEKHSILHHSEEVTTVKSYLENRVIEGLNWKETGKNNDIGNDTNEMDFLDPIDDKYETLLQELQSNDIQHRDKSKHKKRRNKKKKIKVESQSETREEIKHLKNYIKKEVEELKSTYDKVSPNNHNLQYKFSVGSEKFYQDDKLNRIKKIKNITKQWLPIKSDGKTQWTERGPEKNNITILKYFEPKKIRNNNRVKRKKNRKYISFSKGIESDGLKGKEMHETYLINVNLQDVNDTHMPFLKSANEDIQSGIFNKSREIYKTNDRLIITTASSKNIEVDIANSYAKNNTNKIKRQSYELLKKLEDDKNVGYDLLYHFEDFSSLEKKSTHAIISPTVVNFQRKQSKKKKKHQNVHEWFTKMGKKIKNFFNKKHHAHHEVYLNEAAPINIEQ